MADDQHHLDPKQVALRAIELLGGHEQAFNAIDAEYFAMLDRWNQDVTAIGRILRSHLYVEYYLTEYLQKSNPKLGDIDDARLSFAQKANLIGDDYRIGLVAPGVKRMNVIRNRLAHNLEAAVTADDVQVFLAEPYFAAMREVSAKPNQPSADPLDIYEEFAQYASSALHHQWSVLGKAFGAAHKDLMASAGPN